MKKALSLVLALLMLMSLCITPVMAAEPEGSESNPYYVANPMAAPGFITIPANSAVYYQYNAAVFNGWEVGGYGLTSIIVDGVVYDTPDMWGEIYAPLNFNMMSPGIVAYVNDTAEDVQVMISHNEPLGTENNPDTMEDGENAFSIPANNPSYVVDYVPTANGEYTFSTEQSEDFIISIDIDGTAYTLDGSLTLELESYIPVRFYISPIGVTGDIVLTVTPPKAGTEGNPHWLEVDTLYEINGTEPTYFQVDGSLSGNELLIESFNGTELTITLDGVEYITKGGALYVPLETENWVMNLVISQTSSAKNTVYFSVEYAEGTEQNPIKLVGGDNEISIPEGVEGYYYAYTVEKDGLLVATPAAVDGISYLSMANADYSSYAYLDEGASSMMMPVTAGEVITFECYPLTDEETWVALGVDTVLNIAVKNLALFSNFDSGELPEGWKLTTGGLSGVSDDISNSGFYSLKLEGDAYAEILYTAPVAQIEGVTYTVEFDVNAITSGGINFQVKRCPGDDPTKGGNLMNEYIDVIGGEWQHYTYTFDADILPDRDHFSLLFVVVDGTDFYLDNVSVTYTEKSGDPSFDGYIYNGDFETGKVEPWDNLWGSCPTVEIISGGKDSDYALHVVSGQWLHVRQTGIAVEPNTDYKITAWAKDAKDMSLLVKDGGDTKDLKNAGVNAGAEWTQFTAEFNTGDYTTIIFSLMGSTADAYGTFDNIVIEKIEGGDDPVDPPVDENLGENIFAGGDFTDGANDWNLDSGGSTIVAEDGVGHIDFNADWGYAMKGTSVSSNTDYRLSFRAKAINGSGMNVNFKNGSWADCGIDSYKGSIAADWTEYTYDFNSGDNNYLLLFFQSGHYGSDDFQVWIDDIRVQEILATDPGDDPTIDPPVAPVVPENAIVNDNFDDGETQGWSSSSTIAVVDGVLEFQCTQNWANIYKYVNAMKPNTDYVYRFNARANMKQTMNIKVNNNWAGDTGKGIVDVTTEWQTYEVVVNSGDLTSTALVLFSSNVEASAGLVLYLDNISIAEVAGEEPSFDGYIYNGDFETGDNTGWEIWQSTEISADAAHSGSYGAHLQGNGSWGGMLNQTVTVIPGKTYKLSFWINVVATGCNVQVKDGSGVAIEGAGGWFDAKNVDKLVEWTFVATDDKVLINFCGGGNGNAESVYVDDFSLVEVNPPSNDGYITNGDFETGDLSSWTNLWGSCTVEFVEGYESTTAISVSGGSWTQVRQNGIAIEPDTDYILTAWVKNANNFALAVKTGDDSADIKTAGPLNNTEWTKVELKFNTGVDKSGNELEINSICVLLMSWDGGGSAIVDNVTLVKDEGGDEPGDDPIAPPVAPEVPENAIVNDNFDDGETQGWSSSSDVAVVDGVYVFQCTKDWANMYKYVNAMKPNTDYVYRFNARANMDETMNIKVNNNWAGDTGVAVVNVTTEWQTYEVVVNSGDLTSTALVLFSCNVKADKGLILYLDNISIAEVAGEEPSFDGYIYNGDFETGDNTGWEIWQSTEITADAAHSGKFGAHLQGNGSWGGMLNQTVTVIPGKTYKLSFWINVVATGCNVQVKDGSGVAISGAGGWFDANNVDKLVEWTFVATDDSVFINFCGGGNGNAESVYVDDFSLVQMEDPSFDGYITNGDFETGDLTSWINLWDGCTITFVEGYESNHAVEIVANKQWSHTRQNLIPVEANTTYRLSAYVKNAQDMAFVIKEGNDSFDLTPSEIGAFPAGDEWQLFTMEFNTGVDKNGEAVTIDSICVLVIGYGENGGSVIIDNITLEKVEEIEPEYLPGDVSGDGRVNNRDLGMLQQYLSDMDVKITNMNACDVTGDGRVNNRDLGVLQQYLSDMDVELKYGAIEE